MMGENLRPPMKRLLLSLLLGLAWIPGSAQVVLFQDTFTQPDGIDLDWTSQSGGWWVAFGYYYPSTPSPSPPTVSLVNAVTFTDGTVSAEVIGPMDGALVVRANGATSGVVNAVYFVFRPGDAYFHVASGGSVGPILNSVGHAALPATYRVNLTVTGSDYLGSITSLDGNTTYATTMLSDSTYASGAVGLYANTGYPTAYYDAYTVTAAVPEPATSALLTALLVGMLVAVRRSQRRIEATQ